MPQLYYTTKKFEAIPKKGRESFSAAEVLAHATSVGDASIYSDLNYDYPRRPLINVELRKYLTRNGLENLYENKKFQRSHYFDFLDGSEQSAISYNLGMTQCAMMATRLLNAKVTVHLDAVCALISKNNPNKNDKSSPTRKKPDLLAYTENPDGLAGVKFILEAKGRKDKDNISGAIHEAKKQFSSIPKEIQEISEGAQEVISVSYFEKDARKISSSSSHLPSWKNYLEAVPPARPPKPENEKEHTKHTDTRTSSARNGSSQADDGDEFAGLLLIAQLWPFVQMISTPPEEERSRFSELLHGAVDPRTGDYFGVPEEIYNLIKKKVKTPLVDTGKREEVTREAWEIWKNLDVSEVKKSVKASANKTTVLPSGLTYINLSRNAKSSISTTKTVKHSSPRDSRIKPAEKRLRRNSKRGGKPTGAKGLKTSTRGFNRKQQPITLITQQQAKRKSQQINSNHK